MADRGSSVTTELLYRFDLLCEAVVEGWERLGPSLGLLNGTLTLVSVLLILHRWYSAPFLQQHAVFFQRHIVLRTILGLAVDSSTEDKITLSGSLILVASGVMAVLRWFTGKKGFA